MKTSAIETPDKTHGEQVFFGIGISVAAAIGAVHVVNSGLGPVPKYPITQLEVDGELSRFRKAVSKARQQVIRLKTKTASLTEATAEELELLLDAQAAMLASTRMLYGVETAITEQKINAESCVQIIVQEIAQGFAKVKDPYLAARVQDIRDVGSRILRQLMQTPYQAYSRIPKGSIIVTEELSPADIALIDPSNIVGFATEQGATEGHTAIMARSMNLPAVLGLSNILSEVYPGQTIIVDGDAGRIILDPSKATLLEYRRKTEARKRLNRQLARLRALPAVTRDGKLVGMHANIELARDVEAAIHAGAEGIGLLRTEFMLLNRTTYPNEEEQYHTLKTIVMGMSGKPVTIRTLDLNAEGLPDAMRVWGHNTVNPLFGRRAVRLSVKQQKLFEIQLSAILRVSKHGPVKILLPMISSVHQIRHVKRLLEKVLRRLRKRGNEFSESIPPIGAMIEVPGAALIADSIAQEVDFFAIGTNDLTMYTLAIDREDEQVASLFNPLHPAVLRLIQITLNAAQRNNKPVSICGEIAGDPRFAPLLIGLGARDLSMASQNLPRVKQRIRALDTGLATRRALAILDQTDEDYVRNLLDDFNESL
ncbi:MAG: phosphoenolpyruvate--protein phosphotransferase [Rhodospirillaceae bacterium]|nr:phosphoenolpyruvate--protein phosphotransferase [Rhodospirillaceae bacterium]|tara:strand:+ start:1101 stop:2885 length:1785 start_codon:yes stop_codon:yes gene_type:complete